ncbi:hypothetical protein NIES4103_37090 [Nostoc sp. NIES-4103]|nr:hypothetical protein NIES4103_37090 [Nostoc sp. NIES-4103]
MTTTLRLLIPENIQLKFKTRKMLITQMSKFWVNLEILHRFIVKNSTSYNALGNYSKLKTLIKSDFVNYELRITNYELI